MADVFISYASEDRDHARKLASALEARGWSVWWDRKIIAGQTFDQIIEHELDTAKSVVVLWSKDSISSEWVKNEAAVAAERGALVPALIDSVKLPLEFRRKHAADLIGWDGDPSHEGFQMLCDGVATRAHTTSVASPTAPPRSMVRWNRQWTLGVITATAIMLGFGVYWGLSITPRQPTNPPPNVSIIFESPSSFVSYQSYLQELGYVSKTGQVGVFVDPQLEDNAYYDKSHNLIVLGKPFAADTDVIFREYTHHALMSVAKVTRAQPDWAAIESSLADYFPCSFSNDPLFGEKSVPVFRKLYGKQFDKPYIRNLENNRKFSELSSRSPHQDAGEIWGGAFWEMRGLLGQGAADKLLFSTWVALQPSDSLNDAGTNFVNKLLETVASLPDGTQASPIRSVFERRGLNLNA